MMMRTLSRGKVMIFLRSWAARAFDPQGNHQGWERRQRQQGGVPVVWDGAWEVVMRGKVVRRVGDEGEGGA